MKIFASNLFLAVSAMLLVNTAHAAVIMGNAADAETYPTGGPGAVNNGSIVAGNYYTGAGGLISPVFVFQLPTLAVGQSFSNVTFNVTDAFQGGTFDANLVGLTRTSGVATVLASDYSAASTTLQNSFLTPTTPDGAVVSGDLASFLNTQYAGGANAGQYVFLRVDPQGDTGAVFFQGYFLATANNGTTANQPFLSYSVVPEPTTCALGALGALALLRRRR